jgi:hypothetical protein
MGKGRTRVRAGRALVPVGERETSARPYGRENNEIHRNKYKDTNLK